MQVRFEGCWYTERGIKGLLVVGLKVFNSLRPAAHHVDSMKCAIMIEMAKQKLDKLDGYFKEDWQDIFSIAASGARKEYTLWWSRIRELEHNWETYEHHQQTIVDLDAWLIHKKPEAQVIQVSTIQDAKTKIDKGIHKKLRRE